jgi:hypothetical protein
MLIDGLNTQELTVLNAGIGSVEIAQTLGPLKYASQTEPAMKLERRSIDT